MASGAGAGLAEAQEALAAGDWAAVRTAFEAALQRGRPAAASFGLGVALWWLGKTRAGWTPQSTLGEVLEWRRSSDRSVLVVPAEDLVVTGTASC